MYDLIKNPNTNRYISINSNLGRSILRNYLYTSQTGGLLVPGVGLLGLITKEDIIKLITNSKTEEVLETFSKKINTVDITKEVDDAIEIMNQKMEKVTEISKKIILKIKIELFTKFTETLATAISDVSDKINEWEIQNTEEKFHNIALAIKILGNAAIVIWKEAYLKLNTYGYLLRYIDIKLTNKNIPKKEIENYKKNDNVVKMIAICTVLRDMLNLFAVIIKHVIIYENKTKQKAEELQKEMASLVIQEDVNIKGNKLNLIQKTNIELNEILASVKALPSVKPNTGVSALKLCSDDKFIIKLIDQIIDMSPCNPELKHWQPPENPVFELSTPMKYEKLNKSELAELGEPTRFDQLKQWFR